MPENNIIKLIKKSFTDKNFASVFLTSLLSVLLIIVLGLSLVWHYRARVFGYFAKEYFQEMQNANNKYTQVTTERILEKQTIFSQESFVVDAVKKTNPAVVSIVITKEVPKYEAYTDPNQQNNPFGDLFPGFNFNIPQYRKNAKKKKNMGGGSGFFVSSDGLVFTKKQEVNQMDVNIPFL